MSCRIHIVCRLCGRQRDVASGDLPERVEDVGALRARLRWRRCGTRGARGPTVLGERSWTMAKKIDESVLDELLKPTPPA